jgi:hypothetical protein
MLKRRVAFFDLVNALIVASQSTALQTPNAAVINRFGYGSSGGIMPGRMYLWRFTIEHMFRFLNSMWA